MEGRGRLGLCVRVTGAALVALIGLPQIASATSSRSKTVSEVRAPQKGGTRGLSVFKISNRRADLFSGEPDFSHGTGFLVEILNDPRRGPVAALFTNRHVIETGNDDVQRISVEIPTETLKSEVVAGRVAYVSPVHDFAVVEFDLRRARGPKSRFQPVRLPSARSPLFDLVKNPHAIDRVGRVFAQGNPLESQNIVTYGWINGVAPVFSEDGYYIQTQTPISPGNSGGPLIREKTGEVIGINTAVMQEAANMGFAIPIGPALEEYRRWRENSRGSWEKVALFAHGVTSEDELVAEGLKPLIEAAVPDFFEHHSGILKVEDAHSLTNLQSGDLVLKVNDRVIGDSFYEFDLETQKSRDFVRVDILRSGRRLRFHVPLLESEWRKARARADYVMIAGLLFREYGNEEAWYTTRDLSSRLHVSRRLDSPEARFGAYDFPPEGSLVLAVEINGEKTPVAGLFDLKMALQRHPGGRTIRLHVRPAIFVDGADGGDVAVMNRYNLPALEAVHRVYEIPIAEVFTPLRFSLQRFRKAYRFGPDGHGTRDWRAAARKAVGARSDCEEQLK